MVLYTKESLELVRRRADLVEIIGSHVDLKRAGSSFKALCPFHDESTPSFILQGGDTHYHCFGCGAHGDAIQFLMQHLKMSFVDAIEYIAERFQVPLQQVEQSEPQGLSKNALRDALESACRFYHFFLLFTREGQEALDYLSKRGISIEFIKAFQIGLSPKSYSMFRKVMHAFKHSDQVLLESGLLSETNNGEKRDFFSDRIMFPIRNVSSAVIGFSARKYKESTYGGKYINTPETVLFKKSQVLFGLNYSRKRICKERRVIIVEGQIDALRLIQEGFNFTVAGQGTAFGAAHAKELIKLGVNTVYLSLDSDTAGREAAVKIGHLFQKEGVEVFVIEMESGKDPDLILREKGAEAFLELIEKARCYLEFLVSYYSLQINSKTPAGKTELIKTLKNQIVEWENPVMVHESLKKIAHLLEVPEDVVGASQEYIPKIYVKRQENIGLFTVDPNQVLEMDLIRWLLLDNEKLLLSLVDQYILPIHFRDITCKKIYQSYMHQVKNNRPTDLLSLAIELEDEGAQNIISQILHKKVNKEKVERNLKETMQKILEREWMFQREEIRAKIQQGAFSEEDVLLLVKQFDTLKKNPPKVV